MFEPGGAIVWGGGLTRGFIPTMTKEAGMGPPGIVMTSTDQVIDYESSIRAWKRAAPWYRRLMAWIGLQGKLVLCFMAILAAALGGSSYLFMNESKARLADIMGEQARQIGYALSLASRTALAEGDAAALHRMGRDLLTSRNVLFVAFLDDADRPLTFASRESKFDWNSFKKIKNNTESLMRVQRTTSPLFGEHVEIVVPVLSMSSSEEETDGLVALPEFHGAEGGSRLLGYVAVGLSQAREQQQLMQVNYSIIGIGCLLLVIALPLAYTMVRRIFYPIRQLVDATIKIAEGDYETQVAIHRPDMIGVLARTFNQMVGRICLQQRQLEQSNQQLAQANQDLEDKVRDRTALLETTNRRLSSEITEKEDFLRAISHDLNAPLRNITGMATMLLHKHRESMNPDMVHRLERIQKNVEVESDLIGELLELSRLKTRRQKMEMVEVDAMVRELGEILDNDLKTGAIKLIIDTPLPVLLCERARLRQVFQNLIDNAIKYMGEGMASPDGPIREIHVGCTLRAGEAEFYVRDTGIGIHPDDLAKVFVVFRRGKNGSTCGAAGKGVGLASVKSIVEMYNGAIWVESELGKGSTFRFTVNGKHVPACACRAGKDAPAPEDHELEASIIGSAMA